MFAKTGIKLYKDMDIDLFIDPLKLPTEIALLVGKSDDNIEWKYSVGDTVPRFFPIALNNGHPIISSVSGVLTEIKNYHFKEHTRVVALIKTESVQPPLYSVLDVKTPQTASELIELSKTAGICDDFNGSWFFESIEDKEYSSVILSCADDEPFVLTKTAVLFNFESEVIGGLEIIKNAVSAKTSELDIIKSFKTKEIFKRQYDGIKINDVKNRYPVSAKLMKKQTKKNALIVGPECCKAVYRAVNYKEPQTKKVITVWGDGVANPKIAEVFIGTKVCDVLNCCGAFSVIGRIVASGVMSGYLTMPEYPVNSFDKAVTVLPDDGSSKHYACINCGRCSEVCPVGLAPSYILDKPIIKIETAMLKNFDNCIGCGCCSYICPAKLPLRSYIKSYNAQKKRERGGINE